LINEIRRRKLRKAFFQDNVKASQLYVRQLCLDTDVINGPSYRKHISFLENEHLMLIKIEFLLVDINIIFQFNDTKNYQCYRISCLLFIWTNIIVVWSKFTISIQLSDIIIFPFPSFFFDRAYIIKFLHNFQCLLSRKFFDVITVH